VADATAPVAVPGRGVSDAVRRAGIRWGLRLLALAYLTLLLLIPVALVLWKTFQNGLGPIIDSLTNAQTVHAFQITIVVAFYSVIACTIFGVGASLLLVRHEFRG
jgi:sulfate transport system permease protein